MGIFIVDLFMNTLFLLSISTIGIWLYLEQASMSDNNLKPRELSTNLLMSESDTYHYGNPIKISITNTHLPFSIRIFFNKYNIK